MTATISARASAGVAQTNLDRDRLREQWRLAALEWSRAEDNASRLEEGRKLLLDDMTLRLVEGGEKSMALAEKKARVSEQFRGYLRKMHDARRIANDLKIEASAADRIYWDHNNREATERAERRMSR